MTPRPYQIVGRDFLADRRTALLADQMRVGKTPQAILAAKKVDAKNALVVCPAIAVDHWKNEWRKWDGPSGVTVISFNRAVNYPREKRDLLIVDECHFAKNPLTQRTRAIYGRDGHANKARRVWALSGTPAVKHAGELWPLLAAFGKVNMDYDEFLRTFCIVNLEGRVVGTKVNMVKYIQEMLEPIMLRRTRKQVAPEMPEIEYEFLPIAVAADLPKDVDVDRSIDHEESRQEVALAKAPHVAEQVAFAINNGLIDQTVVFAWHVAALELVRELLIESGITTDLITGKVPQNARSVTQQKFRSGEVKVVCANILAAGTAIDLSSARHGYFLELDWVPGNNAQAASRLVAVGKDDKVTFDVCTKPGSVDDAVNRVLLRRTKELSKLFD